MSEVKYAISILKEKLANADRHNLACQRLSVAEMEAIWGTLEKSDKDYAKLKAQRDALAAENAALKSAIADYAKVKQDFDNFDGDLRGMAENLCEAEGALVSSIKTPSTDAHLNSVRAEGIQMLLNKYAPHTIASSEASEFAAQIRPGKDGE